MFDEEAHETQSNSCDKALINNAIYDNSQEKTPPLFLPEGVNLHDKLSLKRPRFNTLATAHGMHFLLTWNFKHINNAETKSVINKTIEGLGYIAPILCSPEELGASS